MPKSVGIIESLTQRIENLEQLVEDQARELEQLRAEVAWRDGKSTEDIKVTFSVDGEKVAEAVARKSDGLYRSTPEERKAARKRLAQRRRDGIVDRARQDIQRLEKEADYQLLRADYVINREKRTIVCLLERYDYGYIEARGKAKCAPDDCFNIHIGKAIALRRALDLEVPDDYIYAPQPTEVRVGDTVWSRGIGVVEVSEPDAAEFLTKSMRNPTTTLRVIDDSREEV